MNITMHNVTIESVEDIKKLLEQNQCIRLEESVREKKYDCVREVLTKVRYTTLRKKERGVVKRFLRTVTSYCDQQLKRLIKEWKGDGGLVCAKRSPVGAAKRKYRPDDIALLIKTDTLHKVPNGASVKETLQREYLTFGHKEYETIAGISVSHIYNIRNHNQQYRSSEALQYTKTKPTPTSIGERTKPEPQGKPGSIRVDSVHQGDKDKEKGVYHINLVDEVLQWEMVVCVEGISERFMLPALNDTLEAFPFVIQNFHSDNGSEYINKKVAALLERLRVKQTKSRSRKTNDNALVESKNGSVIRKHMGRNHIPKKYAPSINQFYQNYFNTYLNYHRVCAYATDYIDKRGKVRKKYDRHMTPYENLKSLKDVEQYLKLGVTIADLDKIAYAESDNEFAEKLAKAKSTLLKTLSV